MKSKERELIDKENQFQAHQIELEMRLSQANDQKVTQSTIEISENLEWLTNRLLYSIKRLSVFNEQFLYRILQNMRHVRAKPWNKSFWQNCNLFKIIIWN